MGKGIVKLGEGQWAVKDGNLLAAKETNGRFKNTEFTVSRGTRASYVGRDGLIKESNLQDVNLVNNGDFSELGSELVTNGAFDTDSDWNNNVGNDWQIVNGKLILTTTSYNNINQGIGLVQNKFYKIVFTIANTTLGGVRVRLGTGTITSEFTNGTHTIYLEQTTTNDAFRFYASSSGVFDGEIDNVSVKEVDPNDYWTLGTYTIVQDGKATITNSTGEVSLSQSIGIAQKTIKVTYTISDYVSGVLRVQYGAINGTNRSANGTYTDYITGSNTSQNLLIYSLTSDTSLSIDNISVKEVKIDTPRIDFTDNTDGHLLLEPQSTNLLTYSEDFTNWTKLNGGTGSLPVVTSNTTISPSGEQNADTIFFDKGAASGGGDYSLLRLDYGGADVDGTASIYLKADANVDIEISSDDGSYQTVSVTNTWQRFSVSDATSDRLSMGLRGTVPSNNTATVYAWGGQLEALSYPTSHIPTNGSTVTRDADTCNSSGSSADFNSEEGVLYAEINALSYPTDLNGWLTITDGTANNSVGIVFETTPYITGRVELGGVNQAYLANNVDYSNFVKVAVKYKANDFALWINGVEVATDTSGNTFSANTLNSLQFSYGGGTNNWKGKIKAVKVYKEALSDTDLQNLTS